MKNAFTIIGVIALIVAIVGLPIFFGATPAGKAMWNNWFYNVQKADDVTNYETIKEVEDTCRAMISSYESDKLTYEQYKDSDNEEKQGWAEQAKIRANKTATTYNNYILKNSFVWKDNIPNDDEVIWVEDVTNNYHSLFSTIDEPIYKIRMVVNCYGCKTTEEVVWRKGLYETNIKRGYYLAYL